MIDIKFTSEGDIDLNAGDVTYQESTKQHKWDILMTNKGHFKECQAVGVGTLNFINDTEPENLFRTIRKECVKDGMKVTDVIMTNGELTIDAEYENNNNKA